MGHRACVLIAACVTACGGNSPPAPNGFAFQENFAAADGSAWPSAWHALGGVDTAAILGGRRRLTPRASAYSLAPMGHTPPQRDRERTFPPPLPAPSPQG